MFYLSARKRHDTCTAKLIICDIWWGQQSWQQKVLPFPKITGIKSVRISHEDIFSAGKVATGQLPQVHKLLVLHRKWKLQRYSHQSVIFYAYDFKETGRMYLGLKHLKELLSNLESVTIFQRAAPGGAVTVAKKTDSIDV